MSTRLKPNLQLETSVVKDMIPASHFQNAANEIVYKEYNTTIANLRASTNLFYPVVFTTDKDKEGFWKFDSTDTTSVDNLATVIVDASGGRWKRVYGDFISVKWFDAKGDNSTDDIIPINLCARYCETVHVNMYFPTGGYKVSNTIIAPTDVRLYGEGQFTSIIATPGFGIKEIILCDSISQFTYRISDIRIDGGTTGRDSNTVIGLRVGSSRNSQFKNIQIIQCWGQSLLVQGKDTNGQDVENPTFEMIYTAIGTGMKIVAGSTLTRGNITNSSFTDCNFTTDSLTGVGSLQIPIVIECQTDKTIFGVNILNSFTQPRNSSVIKLIGIGSGFIYNCTFVNIQSDIWGSTSLSDYSDTVPVIQLTNANQCVFNKIYTPSKMAGIVLVNSMFNTFQNLRFDSYANQSNSRMFNFDSTSVQNVIENFWVVNNNELEMVGGPFSNSQDNLFGDADLSTKKIILKDDSKSALITNSIFKNVIKVINSPKKLFDVNGTNLRYYSTLFNTNGVTCAIVGGKLRVTIPSGITGTNFFDIPVNTDKPYGAVRLRYKFLTTGFTGTVQNALYGFAKPLIADGAVHEQVWVTDTKYQNHPYYGFLTTGPLNASVTIEIEKWEIYEGYNLPFIPNYTAIDDSETSTVLEIGDYQSGTILISGTGTSVASFTHTLGAIPSFISVTPGNADAASAGISFLQGSSSTIFINTVNTTTVGTNNLKYYWEARI